MKSLFLLVKKYLYVHAIFPLAFGFFLVSPAFSQTEENLVPENEAKTHYMLGILGFNYTDQYIVSFSIDGQGGGDVRLSSPTSGGSGTVCCVLLSKKPKWPMHVLVRWQSGGCRVYESDRLHGHNQYYYSEATVNVERGSSRNPTDIAVHFFKNGSVRVMLSDGWDPPLLLLPNNRAPEKYFQKCKPGEPSQEP